VVDALRWAFLQRSNHQLPTGKVVVIAVNRDLRKSLAFALQADGYVCDLFRHDDRSAAGAAIPRVNGTGTLAFGSPPFSSLTGIKPIAVPVAYQWLRTAGQRMRWVVIAAMIVVALGGASAVYLWISSLMFDARIDDLRKDMFASQQEAGPLTRSLPEIVRAYAVRNGGRMGGPAIFHVRHEATLATSRDAPPIEVQADQWTGVARPGFVWAASGSINGLPVKVFDSYVGGRGELSARVLGTFEVAGGIGPDYDKGELMRYLSELPVHPDAILNGTGTTWRQLDERTVEVSARSATGPAAVRFTFDDAGDIARLESDDRPMAGEGGKTVPTPWHGIYSDYVQFGRYRIPSYGEVGWVLPGGLFTYWRGRIVAYEPIEAAP
jgi:hypothetical protein